MKPNAHDPKTEAEKILELMYFQGKAQFGDAVKSGSTPMIFAQVVWRIRLTE